MKMLKLIQNEIIKIMKKTSSKILVILAVVALLGAVGLANLAMSLNNLANNYTQSEDEWKQALKDQISSMKKSLEQENIHYDEESLARTKGQMETYELALKYKVNYIYAYNPNYWKTKILSEIEEAKINLELNKEIEKQRVFFEKIVNERVAILENDDFGGYIEFLKSNKKIEFDNKKISKEEYDDEIYLLELSKKYEIGKEQKLMGDWKTTLYNDVMMMKNNLRTGINQSTGKLLKVEEIEKIEDNIKIAEYRLENNIPTSSVGTSTSARSLYDMLAPSFSLIMVSILMIIITGSSISTEISKGTIKFLLFTPNKRWKVLLSKILSALIILFVLCLVLSLLSVVIGNIFFKDEGTIYVYASHGEAKSISNLAYTVLYYLTYSIDIIIYMLFALTLSVVTRNTALSVGVSIACYVGSGTIMELINYFISADWLKFIPFNNMGLVDKIFINNITYMQMQSVSSFTNEVSIGFSLVVLSVCAILMLITMFDSFNKRDIT